MDYNFFAFINRMKYIERWGLMRNATKENLQEHSLVTAMVAHMLCLIENKHFGGDYDADKAAVYAIYHDAQETITGDMPTPVKYFDGNMREMYGKIEEMATNQLLEKLPEEFRPEFEEILTFEENSEKYKKIVKAADKISAYIKCVEEEKFGNGEFSAAKATIFEYIKGMELGSANYFMENFIPAFSKSLDEIS